MSWRIRDLVHVAVALAITASPAPAQEPTLATVLERAAAYVTGLQRQLSRIVAEDRYIQEITSFASGKPLVPLREELRSDLLLVKPMGANEWVQFRDVFEADGQPVRDRSDRLTRLFLNESPSARVQVGRILAESARFNLGDVTRNVNVPVFALQFLEPSNQRRFKFERSSKRVPETFSRDNTPTGAFRTSTEVWVVEYKETQAGTIVRTIDRRDFPVRGRFWIEPSTGRVLMTELVARDRTVNATIDVSFQSEPLVGVLVPIEMREKYQDRGGSHITGVATYGRFRQFTVNVDETFLIKK